MGMDGKRERCTHSFPFAVFIPLGIHEGGTEQAVELAPDAKSRVGKPLMKKRLLVV
jgi:hypothetical protein